MHERLPQPLLPVGAGREAGAHAAELGADQDAACTNNHNNKNNTNKDNNGQCL